MNEKETEELSDMLVTLQGEVELRGVERDRDHITLQTSISAPVPSASREMRSMK